MKRALMVLALGQARDPRSFVRVNAGHAIRRTRFRDTVFHSVFARGTIVYTHTHTRLLRRETAAFYSVPWRTTQG